MKSFLFLFVFLFWNGCLFAQEIQCDSIKVDSNESRMPLLTTEPDSVATSIHYCPVKVDK